MGDACDAPCPLAGLKQKLGLVTVDGIPGHVGLQNGADDVAEVGGILHAVGALNGQFRLLQETTNDELTRDRIVVGDGKAIHPLLHHAPEKLLAGDERVRFGGVIVQLVSFEHSVPLTVR